MLQAQRATFSETAHLRGAMDQQRDGSGGAGEDRGGSSEGRSSNDDRSDVMNPNNDAYDADQANREEQEQRGW
ncbi:MAG: hypothetical protein AVDCRST_MAG68-5687 [uncultured Gemmatimonadetes bacterium]|uniref:Uncharacterized protein n=1 Tax=uncultured Gemmatimonadota bacterium TaxID=203437 RepID=A0A6J4MYW1_9BACT|nr:MAG: hypothetical protein AVDCRST_MAG68-5687 [uncultured Gemmatimonadota bacterium]